MWRTCSFLCHGDEENERRACMSEHLTTADQSEIRGAHLASVFSDLTNVRPNSTLSET